MGIGKINGVAVADLAKINGVAIATIAKINGVTLDAGQEDGLLLEDGFDILLETDDRILKE